MRRHRRSTAPRRSSRPRPTSRSGIEEEFAILDPRDARPRAALRGAARRGRERRPVLRERDRRRADLLGDRDPLRPRRGPRTTRSRASASARRRLFALAARARRRARRDRHPPVGRLPRAADHRHRALPPRRRRPAVRRAAQQHLLAARPRRRPRRRPRGARLRPPAPGAAAAARDLGATRRSSTAATRGLHSARTQTFTKSFPRCGVPDAFGGWARLPRVHRLPRARRTRSSSTRRSGGRCARTSRFGTVEVRICDAQATAQESEALAALIVACVAQAARDVDEGVPFADPPRRLIEENMWRAIRYGLDGRLIDLERGRGVPGARGDRAAAGVDGAGARRARDRARVPRAQRRPAPARG